MTPLPFVLAFLYLDAADLALARIDGSPYYVEPVMETYDRSPALNLALVTDDALARPRYVPLADAPEHVQPLSPYYRRQLHACAGSVAEGLTVRCTQPYFAEDWEARP